MRSKVLVYACLALSGRGTGPLLGLKSASTADPEMIQINKIKVLEGLAPAS